MIPSHYITTNTLTYSREQILVVRQVGVSVYHVTERYDVSERTAQRIYRRYRQSGMVNKWRRSASRRETTPREDQMLLGMSKISHFAMSDQLAGEWFQFVQQLVSRWTVTRPLRFNLVQH
jgi:predicted transcriptional regulator